MHVVNMQRQPDFLLMVLQSIKITQKRQIISYCAYRLKIVSKQNKHCEGHKKIFSLSVNAAGSLFSTDSRAEMVPDSLFDNKWNKLFDLRYTSMARFAGDVNASFFFIQSPRI